MSHVTQAIGALLFLTGAGACMYYVGKQALDFIRESLYYNRRLTVNYDKANEHMSLIQNKNKQDNNKELWEKPMEIGPKRW